MNPLATTENTRTREFAILRLIAGGLIAILLAIILGLFITPRAMPNWAENVLVGIASVAGLKLGDCLSALVQLASGRQVAQLGEKLAASAPADATPVPANAAAAAQQTADAAVEEADRIDGMAESRR